MEQAAQEKLIRIRSAMEKFEPESFDRNTTSVEHDNDLESFDRNTTSVEPKNIYFEQDDSRKSTEEKKRKMKTSLKLHRTWDLTQILMGEVNINRVCWEGYPDTENKWVKEIDLKV